MMRRLSMWLVVAGLISATMASAADANSTKGGYRGRPSFDLLLAAFDEDENEELAEDEVPMRVWWRLSAADADENGSVSRDEFESF